MAEFYHLEPTASLILRQSNIYNFYKIMAKKALLMILDGWGIGNHSASDAIFSTPTPYWD